jgi:metal-responsive CopG/Arc/MetJ family transcriptional regulator
MTTERLTVTLPVELVESIDRIERNRSRFIVEDRRRIRRIFGRVTMHELAAVVQGLELFLGLGSPT